MFELVQCDAIRWEQSEKLHFSRGSNSWTNEVILILKTPTCQYSCPANINFCFKTCLNVWFESWRLMKSARFQTVPTWLHHTACVKDTDPDRFTSIRTRVLTFVEKSPHKVNIFFWRLCLVCIVRLFDLSFVPNKTTKNILKFSIFPFFFVFFLFLVWAD